MLREAVRQSQKSFSMLALSFSAAPSSAAIEKCGCRIACVNGRLQLVVAAEQRDKPALLRSLAEMPHFVRATDLSVSVPFHTPFLIPMLSEFATLIDDFRLDRPALPIISNVTAEVFDWARWKQELIGHLVKPVQWHNSIQTAIRGGMDSILNAGPGSLSNFSREFPDVKQLHPNDLIE